MNRRTTHLALAAALLAAFLPFRASSQELNGRIESVLANYKLSGATIGVSIIDLESGTAIADIRGDQPMIPASNMKLLTSGAALLALGKDFVFRTELITSGQQLILRGSGDPALADPFMLGHTAEKLTVDGLVSALAAAVRTAGVESITELIVDDRIFDRQYIHPSWPKDQLDRWYCAPVAGLNFHTNVLSFFPAPASGGPGRPPTTTLEPSAPWIEIDNKARTVSGSRNSVWFARDPAADRFTMFGEVAIPTRAPIDITLHDVPLFVGRLIASELPRAGVAVGQARARSGTAPLPHADLAETARSVRLVEPGETFEGRIVAVITTPIEDVLERCNGDSQNLYAESLFKRLGREITREPGSWANGASVVRMMLAEPHPRGLSPKLASATRIADGSGLSRENRIAPQALARWLDRLQGDAKVGEMFVASLASPTAKESLRRRFRDKRLTNDLRAKTGTIDGVRCLSGYLTDPHGRRLAFSIMVNDLKPDQPLQALAFHEEVVQIADRWLTSRGTANIPANQQLGGDR